MSKLYLSDILNEDNKATLYEIATSIINTSGLGKYSDTALDAQIKAMKELTDKETSVRARFIYQQNLLFLNAIRHRLGELWLRGMRPETRAEMVNNERRLNKDRL